MYALIEGKQLHYELLGEQGDPIILVHGWGGSGASLKQLADLLSITNKVILVDLPGFGKSETPPSDWGVEEYGRVIVELLKSLKVKKVIYFGHSFGGSLGILLATTKPQLFKSLILCDSSYKRKNKKSIIARIGHRLLPRNIQPLRILFYKLFFRNSDLARYPHLEQNFRRIVQHDLSGLPQSIKIPTLILWGEGDTITPVSWAHELHEQIKNSTLVIVPNTKHGLPLRNPEIVSREIEKFINFSS